MRPLVALLALGTLTAGLAAQQTPMNSLWRWDLTTEFTSRGGVGASSGFLSQGFTYGDSANLRILTQTFYTIQDQDAATREPWNVGTCGLDVLGDPDYANSSWYATNLRNPAGNGVIARDWTHTGLRHLVNRSTNDQWHHVWNFIQTTNWATDGLGVHMSQAAPWNATLLCQGGSHREIPRTDGTPAAQIIEELGWSTVANNKRPAPQDRTWKLQTFWAQIVLNGASENDAYNKGCPNPNFGYAALDPDFDDTGLGNPARFDNYDWLLEAGRDFGDGVGLMLFSTTVFPNGGVATPFGQLHVDITDPLFGALGPIVMPKLSSFGSSRFQFRLGPGTSVFRKVMATLPTWTAQAFVIPTQGQPQLSSLLTFRPKLLPAGYTAQTTISGTPFSTSRSTTQQTLVLRNDGRGEVQIQPKRGSTNLGSPVTVAERSTVRIPIAAAANVIEVSTKMQTAVDFIYAFNK